MLAAADGFASGLWSVFFSFSFLLFCFIGPFVYEWKQYRTVIYSDEGMDHSIWLPIMVFYFDCDLALDFSF